VQAPWSRMLRDEGGDSRVGTVLTAASPRGALAVRPTDGDAQESAIALTFDRPAEALITGPPVDLSRQRNGDMVLAFSIRLDAAPSGPINLVFGQQTIDIAPTLEGTRPGVWRTLRVRLACFDSRPNAATAVETPFGLRSAHPLRVSLAEIGLASNDGGATCPEP
ncbi:MAG: 1,4-beta-D-glucan glucohydrolase, partial [Brevundimonas sp.]|nr:1,4-beta-D-glucan glucohydrolase [Brevundimonas sp.]